MNEINRCTQGLRHGQDLADGDRLDRHGPHDMMLRRYRMVPGLVVSLQAEYQRIPLRVHIGDAMGVAHERRHLEYLVLGGHERVTVGGEQLDRPNAPLHHPGELLPQVTGKCLGYAPVQGHRAACLRRQANALVHGLERAQVTVGNREVDDGGSASDQRRDARLGVSVRGAVLAQAGGHMHVRVHAAGQDIAALRVDGPGGRPRSGSGASGDATAVTRPPSITTVAWRLSVAFTTVPPRMTIRAAWFRGPSGVFI